MMNSTYSCLPSPCCRTPLQGTFCHTGNWWSAIQYNKTSVWISASIKLFTLLIVIPTSPQTKSSTSKNHCYNFAQLKFWWTSVNPWHRSPPAGEEKTEYTKVYKSVRYNKTLMAWNSLKPSKIPSFSTTQQQQQLQSFTLSRQDFPSKIFWFQTTGYKFNSYAWDSTSRCRLKMTQNHGHKALPISKLLVHELLYFVSIQVLVWNLKSTSGIQMFKSA